MDSFPIQDLLLLLAGVAGTWFGAEVLVRGSVRLALGLGLRPLLVGLTVVAFGTSSPEAVVSFVAAMGGSGGIAVGNVLGSNIANIGLILGIVALLHPVRVRWSEIRRDVFFTCLATALAAAAVLGDQRGVLAGAVLWILLAGSIVVGVRASAKPDGGGGAGPPARDPRAIGLALVQSVAGLVGLVVAAQLMVGAAERMARAAGVDDAIIGATVVAIGTSIPEFATSIVAVARGHYDIGIGNIVGSNLMNLTFVLGTVFLLPTPHPISLDGHASLLVWSMVIFTVILVPMLLTSGRVRRREGAALLAAYVAFSWVAYFRA